jgi:hypothetical protein
MDSIVTVIPYVDKIYCPTYLGQLVTYQQRHSNHGHLREININYTRHELQQLVKEKYFNYELVLLMDSDVIATVEELNALHDGFDGTPLALKTKLFDTSGHICCACCMMRMSDYLQIPYIDEYVDECQCSKIMRQFGVEYLEGYQAFEYRDYAMQTNEFHGEIIPDYRVMPTPGITPLDLSKIRVTSSRSKS